MAKYSPENAAIMTGLRGGCSFRILASSRREETPRTSSAPGAMAGISEAAS